MHASLVNVLTEKIPTSNSIVRGVPECYEKITSNAMSKCISTCLSIQSSLPGGVLYKEMWKI